ncbi:MAG: helix-turn-helix domain-containing protein [Haloarculaceae archaeon]
MASIAEFTLPPAAFPLGRLFAERPDATLELDRVVPSADTVMPYFWVHDPADDMAAVRETFDDLPELRSIALMEDLRESGLFRAEWHPDHMGIMGAIDAAGVTVLSASGSSGGWTFELRADTADQFATFQEYCTDHGIPVSLARLNRLSAVGLDAEEALTPDQREALVLAYEAGYYDDPRGTDLATLADRLGISRQALSARLRRGYRTLVERAVLRGRREE